MVEEEEEGVAAAPAPAPVPVPAVSTAQAGTLQKAQPRIRLQAVGLGMQVAPPTTPPLVQQLGHTRQLVPALVPGLVPMLVKAVAWVVRYDHEQHRMDHSWAMAPQVATKASHHWPQVTPLRVELRSSSQEMCRWRTCSSSCIDSSKRRSPPALPPPQCLVLLTLVPFLPSPLVSHTLASGFTLCRLAVAAWTWSEQCRSKLKRRRCSSTTKQAVRSCGRVDSAVPVLALASTATMRPLTWSQRLVTHQQHENVTHLKCFLIKMS